MNADYIVKRFNELSVSTPDKVLMLQKVFIEMFEASQLEMKQVKTYNQSVNILKKYDQIWKAFCHKTAEDIHRNLYRKFIVASMMHDSNNNSEETVNAIQSCLQSMGWM